MVWKCSLTLSFKNNMIASIDADIGSFRSVAPDQYLGTVKEVTGNGTGIYTIYKH